jgi:hypothetical protein
MPAFLGWPVIGLELIHKRLQKAGWANFGKALA